MSDLAGEIVLRLAKAGATALLGLLLFLVVTGPFGERPSASVALLCWVSAAAFVLLVEESPI